MSECDIAQRNKPRWNAQAARRPTGVQRAGSHRSRGRGSHDRSLVEDSKVCQWGRREGDVDRPRSEREAGGHVSVGINRMRTRLGRSSAECLSGVHDAQGSRSFLAE